MAKLLGIAICAKSREPLTLQKAVEISVEEGIVGDCRGKNVGRQVSIITKECWEATCIELDKELPWIDRRANLLVEGIDFQNSQDKILTIGEVKLSITKETRPCYVMDETYKGLKSALIPDWRGGVVCTVISSGTIHLDDPVYLGK